MPAIKVAKTGGSVTDAEKDLAFTSDRTCLNEVMSGTVTLDGSGLGEVTHGLGYRPSYYSFMRVLDLETSSVYVWEPQFTGGGLISKVDDNKIYFENIGAYSAQVFYSINGNQQENGTGSSNNNISGHMVVAKSGVNIETATDVRQIQFMSGANVPKVDLVSSGSITVTIPTDDYAFFKINHNLGYVPVCYALQLQGGSGRMLPDSSLASSNFGYYITSTQLVFWSFDFTFGVPYSTTFNYKILRDKIA